jgi:pyruvate/2-oxoglutarate dehydrogenase complex dihydrolipoamide acyltransferase (E2) component
MGNLSLSFDHRAFDGAYAARFIGRIKQILEEAPIWEVDT